MSVIYPYFRTTCGLRDLWSYPLIKTPYIEMSGILNYTYTYFSTTCGPGGRWSHPLPKCLAPCIIPVPFLVQPVDLEVAGATLYLNVWHNTSLFVLVILEVTGAILYLNICHLVSYLLIFSTTCGPGGQWSHPYLKFCHLEWYLFLFQYNLWTWRSLEPSST